MNIFNQLMRRITGRIDFSAPENELLHAVFDRMKSQAPPRPVQHERTLILMQEDSLLGDLMPVAVGIVALKKASMSPGYLVTSEFERMCAQAAVEMATIHAEASALFTKMLPKLPGLNVTAGHGKEDALVHATEKIEIVLNLISASRSLLPMETAQLNLCNLMGEKLKVNRFEALKIYQAL